MKDSDIKNAKRIVVKVGTSTLTHKTGKLNLEHIERLVRQLVDLQNQGKEVLLVTSGAVGAGMGKLGRTERPKTIPEKQAIAAIGQGVLMQIYEKFFSEYGQLVAQVLLTRDDLAERERFLHSRHTIMTLLDLKVIPIINENDTVVVDEIKFGDNDTLSALVASLVEADLLIVLTDMDGLYTADPRTDSSARIISVVDEITPEIEAMCGGNGTSLGTGGMMTKVQAAKIAVNSGVSMAIANGKTPFILHKVIAGEDIGTVFMPKQTPLQSRKQWIAFHRASHGEVLVDDGAKQALVHKNKSLLPSGITQLNGEFTAGDLIRVLDKAGREFARGIVNFSSVDLEKIKGMRTSQIEKILGEKFYDEVIHRDNLIVL